MVEDDCEAIINIYILLYMGISVGGWVGGCLGVIFVWLALRIGHGSRRCPGGRSSLVESLWHSETCVLRR